MAGVSGGGSCKVDPNAVHASFSTSTLPAGTSVQTAYTVDPGKLVQVTLVVAKYTGTVTGVTLQLKVGGQEAGPAALNLVTSGWAALTVAGAVLWLAPAETVQVIVTGATLNDMLDVKVHGLGQQQ